MTYWNTHTRHQSLPLEPAEPLTRFPSLVSDASSLKNGVSNHSLHDLLEDAGPSMFDDSSAIDATSPQTLSEAPVNVIRDVIDHHGAIEMVRRLSTMLAERDAHITALTRLAEEYKIPRVRINETASRVKQAERRRLSLATAAEDLAPSSGLGSDSGVSTCRNAVLDSVDQSQESQLPERAQAIPIPAKGITKLFGGGGTRRMSKVPQKPTPASSRSTSRPSHPPERPKSVDVQSIKSVESASWATSMNIFSANAPRRHDSRLNRLPVEMTTRHDPDQLPPTLSNQDDVDPQEAEWNKFMVKLVEKRQENGEEMNGGELIGASRFRQEGAAGRQKLEQLLRLLVNGIPMKLRHPLWMELSNTQAMMQPHDFAYYLNLSEQDDPAEIEAILKDVPRTLTTKYDFYSDKGFERLKEVLVAFVATYPSLGYTQGLNTIAGYLLLAIPSEEDAFWVLCNIVENFFPAGYFSRDDAMISPLADNTLLRQYVKEYLPQLGSHMDSLKIQPGHTVPMKWFFTAFSSALSEAIVMRLWDVWLCLPGQKHFLFAFALALLTHNAEGIMECEDESAYFSHMDSKLNMPEDAHQISELIKLAMRFGKKLEHVKRRRAEEVAKMRDDMFLNNKLRRRRTQSLEVLVDRELTNGDG